MMRKSAGYKTCSLADPNLTKEKQKCTYRRLVEEGILFGNDVKLIPEQSTVGTEIGAAMG